MRAQRKKKEAKKKESRGLWKLPQPWKSAKVACGDFFLMISTAAWKSLRKKRFGFSTVTTGPTAINNQPRSLSFSVSHGRGAVHVMTEFPSDQNWEFGIEHWSDLTNVEFSMLNS